jgi:hypothetical protein
MNYLARLEVLVIYGEISAVLRSVKEEFGDFPVSDVNLPHAPDLAEED